MSGDLEDMRYHLERIADVLEWWEIDRVDGDVARAHVRDRRAMTLAMHEKLSVPGPDVRSMVPDLGWGALKPWEKLRIVEAMGFTRVHSDHDPDCAALLGDGYRCGCVPPADKFSMPEDVAQHLKQDWDSRRARAEQRARSDP